MIDRKCLLSSSVITVALAFTAVPAIAQEDGASVSRAENMPGVIVVTAQRRQENLTDVPISVAVLGGDALKDKVILSTSDLTVAVPGLNWGRSTNFSQPTIRGVGSRNASAGDEPNVASFVDGVYLPDMTGTLLELSNIERIEVLKGPQGTLFGRNATGGAINVVTKAPTDTFNLSAAATYGRFDYYRLTGSVSGPIVGDNVMASLSAVKYDDKGYVRNIYTGKMQGSSGGTAARARFTFTNNDNLTLQVNGFYSDTDNNVLSSPYMIDGNTSGRNSIPGGATATTFNPTNIPASQIIADKPYTTATFAPTFGKTKQWFVDPHVEIDLGFATLSAQASMGRTKTLNYSWTDSTPLQLSRTEYTSLNDFSNQEVVLTSNDPGRLKWLVGVTGFQSDARFDPLISTRRTGPSTFSPAIIYYGQKTNAIAAFGEVTFEAIDNLFITGGIRYNDDKKSAYNLIGGVKVGGEKSFNNWSPRAVVRYEFAPNSSIYGSFTRGFKSGTFNAVSANGVRLPASPELIDAYEVGLKSGIIPGVYAEAAAYYYDYKDLQVSAAIIVNGASVTTVQNAGSASIKGLEFSLNAELFEGFTVFGAVSLIDSKIKNFPNAVVQVRNRNAQGNLTLNGNTQTTLDVSGNELIRAPDYTFSIGANFSQPVGAGRLAANVNAFFSDSYFFDLSNALTQPRYEVVNGSVTYHFSQDRGAYVGVFGQNLTNQVYAAGMLSSAFGDAIQANKPRWWGVTVGYEY